MDEKWLAEFAAGLKSDIAEYGIRLLGGDTVYHGGELVISITAIGKCAKPITRSGAKVGDNIFVSGVIGGGYLGLQAKRRGEVSGRAVEKYELPVPRLDIELQGIASACIDISDGLLADLGHICRESGIGAEIFSSRIPLFDETADLMAQITGGDDYELLFTSNSDNLANCHKIGIITGNNGILLNGKKVKAEGYEHSSN